jgi:EAL domain-containing protein (putative c-di-GMP-specific phosphodiesterase class I)
LRHVELALDRAKVSGGNHFTFFDPAMAEAAERRRELESDMHIALRRQEFSLFYQPLVDLSSNRLVGAEALIRWRHPTRGLVPPDAFIPLAEETGFIVDLGFWVLEAACRQLAIWQGEGKEFYLSINISGRQIPDGMSPAWLAATCRKHGVEASRLVLEITEGVLLADANKALDWLGEVRTFGFGIYLDDFGTGYSSLSYLKRFPVDTVKIDKSFVRDMGGDKSDRALVEAIIAMARSLRLQTVAEGVEDATQLALLREMGCDRVQGYYFSKPVPCEQFDAVCQHIQGLLA